MDPFQSTEWRRIANSSVEQLRSSFCAKSLWVQKVGQAIATWKLDSRKYRSMARWRDFRVLQNCDKTLLFSRIEEDLNDKGNPYGYVIFVFQEAFLNEFQNTSDQDFLLHKLVLMLKEFIDILLKCLPVFYTPVKTILIPNGKTLKATISRVVISANVYKLLVTVGSYSHLAQIEALQTADFRRFKFDILLTRLVSDAANQFRQITTLREVKLKRKVLKWILSNFEKVKLDPPRLRQWIAQAIHDGQLFTLQVELDIIEEFEPRPYTALFHESIDLLAQLSGTN